MNIGDFLKGAPESRSVKIEYFAHADYYEVELRDGPYAHQFQFLDWENADLYLFQETRKFLEHVNRERE